MYSEEHVIFRETFRRFLEREVLPHVPRWEEQGMVDREIWNKLGEQGFLCPWLPEEYGGSGADFLYSVIITEELSKAGAISLMAPLHSDIVAPYIYRLGTEEQKKRWLPRCASGECVLAIAMTEPNTGWKRISDSKILSGCSGYSDLCRNKRDYETDCCKKTRSILGGSV